MKWLSSATLTCVLVILIFPSEALAWGIGVHLQTGAWILDSFDAATFSANFVRNPDWWGGQTPLDSTELRGFADIGTAVTAMQSRDIDAIQQFTVIGGEGLLNDDAFTLLTPPSSAHRQVWFNTQQSQFSDKRLRRAGLDYHEFIEVAQYPDLAAFVETVS